MVIVYSRKKSKSQSGWVKLPKDLVLRILERLALFDYVTVSSICKPWRTAVLDDPLSKKPQPPLLMLPYDVLSETRPFYNLIERKRCEFVMTGSLGGRCCGSTLGWLVLAFEDIISLLNPFSGEQIQLPLFNTMLLPAFRVPMAQRVRQRPPIPSWFPDARCFDRAVLSSVPSAGDCVVAGFFRYRRIAICRLQDGEWNAVEADLAKVDYCDLVFHEGMFYALDIEGGLTVFDVGPNPKASRWEMGLSYRKLKYTDNICLVKSCGELLMVERSVSFALSWSSAPYDTELICSNIYKLDKSHRCWVKFIGDPRWGKVISTKQKFPRPRLDLSRFTGPCAYAYKLICDPSFQKKDILDPCWEGDGSLNGRLLFIGNGSSQSVLYDVGRLDMDMNSNGPVMFKRSQSKDGTLLFPCKWPFMWVNQNFW